MDGGDLVADVVDSVLESIQLTESRCRGLVVRLALGQKVYRGLDVSNVVEEVRGALLLVGEGDGVGGSSCAKLVGLLVGLTRAATNCLVVTATEEKDRGSRKESSGRSEEARKRGSEERKNNPISNATVLTRE